MSNTQRMNWEFTNGYVTTVLLRNGIELSAEGIAEIFDDLCCYSYDRIYETAFSYADADQQIEAVLNEIESILMEDGVLQAA